MELINWLGSDQFDWLAAGLAVSLLAASFGIVFVVILARQLRQ